MKKINVGIIGYGWAATAHIDDTITISASLSCDVAAGALVDYIFWRIRANGALSPKVHKIKKVQLSPGQPLTLSKRHRLKGDATTYRLYPGAHKVSLQVNGKILAEAGFELLAR